MASEIVKYNNDFNQVGLRNFTSVELDILMAIMSRMRDKGLEDICFSFDYLKKLTNWKNTNSSSFPKTLETVYDKLLKLNFKITEDGKYIKFVLFTKYVVDFFNQDVMISVNHEFKWVLNELTKNFTRFELEEFTDFKSSYTKEFFRRMKQFRGIGIWKISLEDFKKQLDIPQNYRITDIDLRVFNPIMNELGEKYNLKIKKLYSNKIGKGRPSVKGFEFTFKKETIKPKFECSDYTVSGLFTLYQSRILKLFDNNFNRYNYCKILNIELKDNKYVLTLKNLDDDYVSKLDYFETQEHLQRFINKYLI